MLWQNQYKQRQLELKAFFKGLEHKIVKDLVVGSFRSFQSISGVIL